jgi:hypothetical protein
MLLSHFKCVFSNETGKKTVLPYFYVIITRGLDSTEELSTVKGTGNDRFKGMENKK